MKIRRIVFLTLIALLFVMLPTAALAADDNSDGYDDNDYSKLQDFLDLPSDVDGKSNGQVLNQLYESNVPATWAGVEWNSETPKRVVNVFWDNKQVLAGDLNLSDFTALEEVQCGYSKITSLDVSGDTALTRLICWSNQLTSLNVRGASAMISILCSSNQLTELDIQDLTALEGLACYDNPIASLDLTYNTNLKTLSCGSTELTSLNIENNPALYRLDCENNSLTALDLSGNPSLQYVLCGDNSNLTSLNLSGVNALHTLDCSGNKLSTLDTSDNANLEYLSCDNNLLSSLDVSNSTKLRTVYCAANQLTAINVNGATALTRLHCNDNQLSSIDASGNFGLNYLICDNNRLTSLQVGSTYLYTLSCNNNLISSLDLTGAEWLSSLSCINNPLRNINAVISGKSIILHANTGGFVELRSDPQNASLYATAVPKRYSFTGWASPAGQVSTAAKYDLTIGNAYKLTANFAKGTTAKSVRISYFLNGGTGNVPMDNARYRSGEVISLPTGEGLTRLGMVFMGWALEDGTVVGDTYTVQNDDVTFYAVWAEMASIPDPPKTGDAEKPAGFVLLGLSAAMGAAGIKALDRARRRIRKATKRIA